MNTCEGCGTRFHPPHRTQRHQCTDCIERRRYQAHIENHIADSRASRLRAVQSTRTSVWSEATVNAFFRTRPAAKSDIESNRGLPSRLRKYGLTRDQWIYLVIKQKSRCAICRTELHPLKLHIDHDHKTSVVRGLLCSLCNTGLGQLGLDGPYAMDRLASVRSYLRG